MWVTDYGYAVYLCGCSNGNANRRQYLMGDLVRFGQTNRCRWCKGSGMRKGKVCKSCDGKGYTEPADMCLHVCGCTKQPDKQLVLICIDCYNGVCETEQVKVQM